MSETQLASMYLGKPSIDDDDSRSQIYETSTMIHVLDGQNDVILDYITANNIIDDNHKKSLEDTLETYDFIAFGDRRYAEHLEKRNRIIIPDEDDTLREFVIFESIKYRDTEGLKAQVFAHASYLELKKASILYPDNGFTGTASQHAGRTLNDTGWQVGIVEATGTRKLTIGNHTNPYEFLKRIAKEFEVELRFRVEHDGNKITGRYVDLLERIGTWQGREVEFGKDLDGIRRIEKQDIVTALLGLGPEREDGTRLEVLVEDEEALQRWGRVDEHGNLHHLIEPYEIQSERSEMTEQEARQYTRTALDKRINTQVTYETTVLDLEEVPGMENKKIRFGDTIRIKDTHFNPPLYLEARVFEMERSIKNKAKKHIKLGDYIEFTEEEVTAIWNQLRNEIRKRVSVAQLEEYAEPKKVESPTPPPIEEGENPIWIDTSKEPNVAHVVVDDEWNKITPTEANEVGAETPQGAQEKADTAEQNAKSYTDIIKSDLEDGIQQAMASADGKNTVFRQSSTPPTTNRKIGDLWFKTNEGNKMYVWTGSWTETKLDHQALSVGKLSAISADLGDVTAGHMQGVTLDLANGKFTVDEQGNVTFKGHIEASEITGSSFQAVDPNQTENPSSITIDHHIFRRVFNNEAEKKITNTSINDQISLEKYDYSGAYGPGSHLIGRASLDFNSLVLYERYLAIARYEINRIFYDPDDLHHPFTFDMPKAKFTGSVEIDSFNDVLWTGQAYPLDTQTIIPSKKLTDCMTGWILRFQAYVVGTGTENTNFQYVHIPKIHGNGLGVRLNLRVGDYHVNKYIYVFSDRIEGHASNNQGDNRRLALTGVFEY